MANLAGQYERAGDFARARASLTEALELQEASGAAEARAFTLAMLGYVSEREGELDEAARWTSLAIETSVALRKHEYLGYGLLFAADLVHRAGDDGSARRGCSAPPSTAFDRAAVVPQAEEAERLERVRGLVSRRARRRPGGRARGRRSGARGRPRRRARRRRPRGDPFLDGLLLGATRGVTVAVVASRERKRRQP